MHSIEIMPMIPNRMKAVLLTGHGGFEKLAYREDVAVPLPAAGEVLVRIGAAAINNTDINVRTAWYSQSVVADTANAEVETGWNGVAAMFPHIQGADGCGRIVAVGAKVAPSRVGERVLIEPLFRYPVPGASDRLAYFGSECDGAFAEFAVVPDKHAHGIESACSDSELASFPCAYAAAENMVERAAVQQGETVLVTGASGGVGSAALQLVRRRGAAVIAVAGQSKAAQLQALGATQVIDRDCDLLAQLGPDSVDVVIDVVGGSQFGQLLQVLRRGGRYAVAGAIAGPVVELDLRVLYLKDLRLLGCTDLPGGLFHALVGYIERSEIKPLVAAEYPLRDVVDAQREFLTKQHVGKIVLTL